MNVSTALKYCYVGGGIIAVLGVLTYQQKPTPILFNTSELFSVAPAMFGYLLFLSLLVERAIEVILTATRGIMAQQMDDQITELNERLVDHTLKETSDKKEEPLSDNSSNQQSISTLLDQLAILKRERAAYRIRSRCVALWLGLIIGIVVSITGVRILGNLVEVEALMALSGTPDQWQINFFILIDVILTGAVLAGGSDAINRMTKRFNHFMSLPSSDTSAGSTVIGNSVVNSCSKNL